MYGTDPAQHIVTAGYDLDNLQGDRGDRPHYIFVPEEVS